MYGLPMRAVPEREKRLLNAYAPDKTIWPSFIAGITIMNEQRKAYMYRGPRVSRGTEAHSADPKLSLVLLLSRGQPLLHHQSLRSYDL